MRSHTKQILALAMVAMMLLSGCAGWGTDGPADSDESENDTTDDLEDEQNQSQNQSDSDDSDSDSDSDSDTGSDTSSGDSSSTSSDSGTDSSSDSSSCSTGDCPDQSDDTDDSTDGSSDADPQGSSGDDGDSDDSSEQDSDDSSDSSDPDSDSDGDSSDGDSSDGTDGTDGTDGDDGDSRDGDEQLTCDAFDTQPEAQSYFDEAPEERGHLDADNDDLPCEHLPDGDDGTDGNETNDTDDPAPTTHELKVSVTDPDENPVEGASVSIVTYDAGEDVASETTNSEGVATFDVPNGDYEAVVTTENDDLLQPSDQRLVTVNGGDATLDVQMQGSGDNGGGEETYTLTVLADSAVTLKSMAEDGMSETKEPTDGVVTFEVPTGEYTLTAEGYYRADYVPIDSDTEIELQDASGAEMDITVVDSETGNGVGGAEISGECDLWYSGGDSYVETTSASEGDGIVTVHTGVTPTTCDANVTAPGYEETQIVLDAPDDDGRTVGLENTNLAVPEPPANESGNETTTTSAAA